MSYVRTEDVIKYTESEIERLSTLRLKLYKEYEELKASYGTRWWNIKFKHYHWDDLLNYNHIVELIQDLKELHNKALYFKKIQYNFIEDDFNNPHLFFAWCKANNVPN